MALAAARSGCRRRLPGASWLTITTATHSARKTSEQTDIESSQVRRVRLLFTRMTGGIERQLNFDCHLLGETSGPLRVGMGIVPAQFGRVSQNLLIAGERHARKGGLQVL